MASPRQTRSLTEIERALRRLGRARALHTLVHGALPTPVLRRLLKDALPGRLSREVPAEVFSNLAVSIALESPVFGESLAVELDDRLSWDRSPATLDEWWPAVRERPLEALWNAAFARDKELRSEFDHLASHCVENWRSSPECAPPSWEFVDGLVDIEAETVRELRTLERRAEEAERRADTEHTRLEELREELRRLRRELNELRAVRARAAREDATVARAATAPESDAGRIEQLERRLRKAEKENAHLLRALERLREPTAAESAREPAAPAADDAGPEPPGAAPGATRAAPPPRAAPPISADPQPRRRVLRHMLRKLLKKGKVGASHTHEDNVYRGLADHDKGVAKEWMALLYQESFLLPKPTAGDPHVSLNPARTPEIRAMIAGEVANPRLRRFLAS